MNHSLAESEAWYILPTRIKVALALISFVKSEGKETLSILRLGRAIEKMGLNIDLNAKQVAHGTELMSIDDYINKTLWIVAYWLLCMDANCPGTVAKTLRVFLSESKIHTKYKDEDFEDGKVWRNVSIDPNLIIRLRIR